MRSSTAAYAGIRCHQGPRRKSRCASVDGETGGFLGAEGAVVGTRGKGDVDIGGFSLFVPRGHPGCNKAPLQGVTIGGPPELTRDLMRQLMRLENASGRTEAEEPGSHAIGHFDAIGDGE